MTGANDIHDMLANAGDDNCTNALNLFRETGFVVKFTVVDPKILIGATSRPRILFVGIHVARYAQRMDLPGDGDAHAAQVELLVGVWVTKINALMSHEHPVIDLSSFLLSRRRACSQDA